ncbi:MAG: hypothetical protein AAGF11_33510 [Myxococcota bacterium]
MSIFDDHQPCPALRRWLLPSWEGKGVALVRSPPGSGWRPPRSLRRLIERAGVSTWTDALGPDTLDVLVVLSPLLDGDLDRDQALPLADGGWSSLRPGGMLVDLASVPRRRAADWVRPWVRVERLRDAAAMRVRRWLDRGAFAPEQWISVDPADVVVTLVRRAR